MSEQPNPQPEARSPQVFEEKPPRLTVGGVMAEIADALFSLDRGLPYTLGRLLRQPGQTIRRYIEWRDPRLTRPLRLALVCLALAAAVMHFSGLSTLFLDGFLDGISDTPPSGASGDAEDAHPVAQAARLFFGHFDLMLVVCWVPAVALAWRSVYSKLGMNLAEAIAFALYTLSIFLLLVSPLLVLSEHMVHGLHWLLPLSGVHVPWAAYGYARPVAHGVWRTTLFTLMAAGLLIVWMLALLMAIALFNVMSG